MQYPIPDLICSGLCEGRFSDVFGLVLVLLSPPPEELISFYSAFTKVLHQIFTEAGISNDQYLLYDGDSLHCTVATFHSFMRPYPSNPERATALWADVAMAAAELPGWPKSNAFAGTLKLQLREAKVHDSGVGVLYYDDTSGIVSQMRTCLRTYCNTGNNADIMQQYGTNLAYLQVPNITHSTILRWRSAPDVSIESLQSMFDKAFAYASAYHDMSVPLSDVKLVREIEPYMKKRSTHTILDCSNSKKIHG